MCGIAGFLKKNYEWEKNIKIMLQTMYRRGPDGDGIWTTPNDDVVLGHRRLSIIDLSDNGSQPMVSMNERYVISFNGEIYNYISLKEKIKNKVIKPFKSTSDTEVLLESFEILGIDETLNTVKGMFGIALYDRKEKKLYLIRDRFGEKPLYYGKVQEQFVFASDLSAIRAISRNLLNINISALNDYFKHGYVSGEKTIYDGIYNVMPGHYIEIDIRKNEVVRKECYWKYEQFCRKNIFNNESLEDSQQKLECLLKESIKQQLLTSDVAVGAFLSGGIDSSLIAALGQEVSNGKLNTYSIGFYDEKYNEAHFAKKASEILGTNHHELYIDENDAKKEILNISDTFSEPFADISEIPTLLVSKMAKRDVTVVLSGDGGDELFGGYTRYIKNEKYWNISKKIPNIAKYPINKIVDSRIVKDERILKRLNMLSSNSSAQLYDRSQWSSILVKDMLNYKEREELYTTKDKLKLQEAFMCIDIDNYLPSDILVKVDRAGMYYSLETRIPFLDKDVAEYAASLPLNYKIEGNKGKIILRNILCKYFPEDFFERRKQGFSLPIGRWVMSDKKLNEWANEMLSNERLRKQGIINASLVSDYWKHYEEGKNSFHLIWRVLMFENWYEKCFIK